MENIASYMPCAWINAHNPTPLEKSDFHHLFVTEGEHNKLSLYGTRTYTYDHPQAPGDCKITVDVSECIIEKAKQGDPEWSMLFLLLNAQNAIKASTKYVEYMKRNDPKTLVGKNDEPTHAQVV